MTVRPFYATRTTAAVILDAVVRMALEGAPGDREMAMIAGADLLTDWAGDPERLEEIRARATSLRAPPGYAEVVTMMLKRAEVGLRGNQRRIGELLPAFLLRQESSVPRPVGDSPAHPVMAQPDGNPGVD